MCFSDVRGHIGYMAGETPSHSGNLMSFRDALIFSSGPWNLTEGF